MQQRPRQVWRRRLLRVGWRAALCLLLGAVTTVGVAWSIAAKAEWWRARVPMVGNGDHWYFSAAGEYWRVQWRQRPGWAILVVHFRPSQGLQRSRWDENQDEKIAGREDGNRVGRAIERMDPALEIAAEKTRLALPVGRLQDTAFMRAVPVPGRYWPRPGVEMTAHTFSYGWPLPAMIWGETSEGRPLTASQVRQRHAVWLIDRSGSAGGETDLPLRPLLPGFLANTLLYAIPWWALLTATMWAGRRTRQRWRRRRGCCIHCGYDLTGLSAENGRPACPECGT